MPRLLEEIEFRNPTSARARMADLTSRLPEAISTRVQVLLASVPDPDQSLHYLDRLRTENAAGFERIANSPAALGYLVTIFSYSKFLSEAILRHPEWLLQLTTSGDLHRVLSVEEYGQRLAAFIASAGVPEALDLARFRRQQLLRIVLRDVLSLASLSDVTEELSNLADAILDLTYRRIREELIARHGAPRYDDGTPRECGCSVISLGKLGGQELNYSSDIDLMFIYSANGHTDGGESITNKEFFKKIANCCTDLLSTYTAEGQCYRVDLRLRPDGRYGEVTISLEGAREYYKQRGRDWELQMLIKARVSAGERAPGRELLEFVDPLIYSTTLDFRAVEAVSETRARIHEKLAAKRAGSGLDIKLARGGIRDIEFLVQCLQRLHGGREPWVRHGGTLFALFRLRDKSLLSGSEYARLASAYQFLRNLEHRLQFDEDRQTHTLPADPEALEMLARRMPANPSAALPTADTLERELDADLEEVQELYDRLIHAQKPIYYTPAPPESEERDVESPAAAEQHAPVSSNLIRLLDQRAPRLAQMLSQAPLRRGRDRFEHFMEKVIANPPWLAQLDSDEQLAACALDIFEHSQYFADQLIRHPDLLEQLSRACESPAFQLDTGTPKDADELRRFYLRHMLRIQCQSVFLRQPIFTTLDHTSDLADTVIAAAYRIALDEVKAANPPAKASYSPTDQMLVIALGRLGMREFDLASDADLVFVLPDTDAPEQLFWTAVAERMIHTISAYTGQGVIFTVDTRLRPHGREGALVQSASVYKDYFAKHAEAWEGIAYMKSRAVAGNVTRATEFLHELQDVDWRRYGQGGRSRKELTQMRARLEKEQGVRNPLKAGRGGYYDIDFALMYLRLKGAGIFFKVLNTPERIDVIEKMGHLEREDAEFLSDAATFYRAIDHGLRIAAGHAEGTLPAAPEQMRILTELVHRWTPERLHDRSLDAKLAQIRERTREFFDRVFS